MAWLGRLDLVAPNRGLSPKWGWKPNPLWPVGRSELTLLPGAKRGIWCVSGADSVVETNKHGHAPGESASARQTHDIIPASLLAGEVSSPAITQKGTGASSDYRSACTCRGSQDRFRRVRTRWMPRGETGSQEPGRLKKLAHLL